VKSRKIGELNTDIIREIIVCLKTCGTEQEIETEQSPFTAKIKGLRSKQLLQRLNDDRKASHNASFSPNTFDKYMKSLKDAQWVRRYAPHHRTVFYELNNEKMEKAEKALQGVKVSGSSLEEIGKLANYLAHNLSAYNEQIFFGVFGELTNEKMQKLIYIRDTCRKIANQLDLLNLSEVKL
jgi:hypothetical protein